MTKQKVQNFEPFLDYDEVDEEMTEDLFQALRDHRESQDHFLSEKTPRTAAAVVETHQDVSEVMHAIKTAIWTIPMMVHVAGTRSTEQNPDDPMEEATIQRCSRCGSVLQVWTEHMLVMTSDGPRTIPEDQMIWWDEGDIVAKASDGTSIQMYEVDPKRKLEKHERECVNLSDIPVLDEERD